MTIVVLEHLTSAPRRGARASALEREGRAMRDAVAADLRTLPGVTVLAPDRSDVPRGASRDAVFRRLLRRADAALVIAPEEDGLLERLVRIVESEGRLVIGPGAAAVRLAADKAATVRLLRATGIPVPATAVVRFAAAAALARRRPPYVLKPRDGCGGAGVVEVRGPRGVAAAVARVKRATLRPDFLWQERVEGIDASVAVLAAAPGAPARFLAIGPCRQRIRRGRTLAYEGGEAPLVHGRAAEALDVARRAVAALDLASGGAARGWLGVDLMIGEDGVRVIEINPRLTTSYIGLRHLVHPTLGGLLMAAACGGWMPGRLTIRGRCRFGTDGRVVTGWRRDSAAGTSAASI